MVTLQQPNQFKKNKLNIAHSGITRQLEPWHKRSYSQNCPTAWLGWISDANLIEAVATTSYWCVAVKMLSDHTIMEEASHFGDGELQ